MNHTMLKALLLLAWFKGNNIYLIVNRKDENSFKYTDNQHNNFITLTISIQNATFVYIIIKTNDSQRRNKRAQTRRYKEKETIYQCLAINRR